MKYAAHFSTFHNGSVSSKLETSCCSCGKNTLHYLNYHDQFHHNPLIECESCGHIQVSPAPSQEQLIQYYANAYSQRRSNHVDTRYLRIMKCRAESQWKMIVNRPNNVLDIGCGYGAFLAAARQRNISAMGLDFDPRVIEYCRALGLSCEFIQSELEVANHLAIRNPDLVVMSHVLEHFRDPVTVLNACARSRVLIEVPAYRIDVSEQFEDQEGHLNFFNERSLLALLQRMHFKVEAYTSCGPNLDLFWRRRWALPRKLLRLITQDYFFQQYSAPRSNGIWLRILVRGSQCKL